MRSRICNPLGMSSTRVTLSPDMKARLAIGHDLSLNAVPNWDVPTLAGAGALRSSVNDLLTFLAANPAYSKTRLAAAIAAGVSIRRPAWRPEIQIAYGSHVLTRNDNSIFWHNGGTGGYRTFMGFDPKSRTGVVVLNRTPVGQDDIGRHLLDRRYQLAKLSPLKEHKEISVDEKAFDGYVGNYQLEPVAIMTISRAGDQLFTQLPGQPKFQLFPDGERRFFAKGGP